MKKEAIDESHHPKQFEAIFKEPEAWAFHRQFALSIAKTRFNLPSPPVGKNDLPRLILCSYLFIRDEIPDLFPHANFDDIQLIYRASAVRVRPAPLHKPASQAGSCSEAERKTLLLVVLTSYLTSNV